MKRELLLQQFDLCYDRNGWFVAIRNALDGVTVEQAAWKPDSYDDNCIWELVSHVTYYIQAYVQRFKGIPFEYDVADNDETFSTGEFTESDWQADLAKFDAVVKEFRELLANAHESKFEESVPAKAERRWWEVIADINAHNAYHGGQILLLRKLQGSWNPQKGVS
jgi:uncharacterized damage-inducible protein DinB